MLSHSGLNNNYNINQRNKLINNFDPSLVKKAHTPNLFHKSNELTGGPIKINNNRYVHKPHTPENSKQQRSYGKSNNSNKKYFYGNNMYNNIPNNNRPSTAPHKDKNHKNNNNYMNNNKYHTHNNNNNYNNPYLTGMMGMGITKENKRLPSPLLHPFYSMPKNQKPRPEKYRVPSPVVKNTSGFDPYSTAKFGIQ